MPTRQEVYTCLDGERDYQEFRKQHDHGAHTHSPEEFLLYMEHYMHLARKKASTVWGPECAPAILDIIRKVTALGVACMEENGVVNRSDLYKC